MYLSVSTVKTYTSQLFDRLGVRSKAHAVHRAYQLGLLTVARQPADRREHDELIETLLRLADRLGASGQPDADTSKIGGS